jgi:hypothetical protein
MAQAHTTTVQNKKLEHLIKVAETFCIKAENGEWKVESGTYKNVLGAIEHTKSEICKQSRQRRRTMNIDTNIDHECRDQVAKENTKDV